LRLVPGLQTLGEFAVAGTSVVSHVLGRIFAKVRQGSFMAALIDD
jgi:hypothetical protein